MKTETVSSLTIHLPEVFGPGDEWVWFHLKSRVDQTLLPLLQAIYSPQWLDETWPRP